MDLPFYKLVSGLLHSLVLLRFNTAVPKVLLHSFMFPDFRPMRTYTNFLSLLSRYRGNVIRFPRGRKPETKFFWTSSVCICMCLPSVYPQIVRLRPLNETNVVLDVKICRREYWVREVQGPLTGIQNWMYEFCFPLTQTYGPNLQATRLCVQTLRHSLQISVLSWNRIFFLFD